LAPPAANATEVSTLKTNNEAATIANDLMVVLMVVIIDHL
jgi:hypothetical protein